MIIINLRNDNIKAICTTSKAHETCGECNLSEYFSMDRTYAYEYGSHLIAAFKKEDLLKKLKFSDKTSFSNVYVSKSCNIPTVVLQSNGITRKRKIEDAEVSVIPDLSFNSVGFDVDIWHDGNTFYVIKHKPNYYYRTKEFKEKTANYLFDFINDDGQLLKSLNLIPEHSVKIFTGSPVKFDKKLKEFMDEFESYKEVMFDSDFNKLLSKNQEDITEENLEYITSLIKSNDLANRDLALNLLFSLNIRPFAYRVAKMLGHYKWHLERVPFYKSTKMDRLLLNIGISRSVLGNDDIILNKTFEYNCQEEKDNIKSVLANKAILSANTALRSLNRYHFFKGYTYQDVIVTHEEKNYSYTG